MPMSINTAVCSLAVAAVASTSAASVVEVTNNGGFETGDTSGWVEFPTANSTFNITGDANSGAFAAEVFNNDPGSSAVVKQANLGIGLVTPGSTVHISFAAKGSSALGGVAFAEFFSELDGEGVSSSEILSGAPLSLTQDYQTFNFTTTAGPDVSGGVTLQFATVTGATPGSTSVLFIDDVSVRVIPTPASAALLGLGGLAVTRRRRG